MAHTGEHVADMKGLAQSSIKLLNSNFESVACLLNRVYALQHFASYLFLSRSGKFGRFVHCKFEGLGSHDTYITNAAPE